MNILMIQTDFMERIWSRVRSKEWWTIPDVGECSRKVRTLVEETHYTGKRSSGFEIMMWNSPVGLCSVAFAKKEWLPAATLATLMQKGGAKITAEQLDATDVLLVGDNGMVPYEIGLAWMELLCPPPLDADERTP